MIDVGIRELKAHLSYYVERAARGETIRVTDRSRPRAILGPLPGAAKLEGGIAEGWIRPPKRRPSGPWRRFRATKRVSQMLEDDRG